MKIRYNSLIYLWLLNIEQVIKMSVEAKILEFLEKENADKKIKLYLNILRVLATYYGVLWLSELYGDLLKLYSTFDWPVDFDMKDIEKSVSTLEKMGFIDVEERFKATYTNESKKEKFIRLAKMEDTLRGLSSDDVFTKFSQVHFRGP